MSFIEKIRRTRREGRLLMKVNQRVKAILYGLRYLIKNDPLSNHIYIHCPNYIEPSKDRGELELVERIFKSFCQMKKDQKKAKEYYLPSPMWQKQLDEDYACLKSSLETDDISKFHFFLTNFGTWKKNLGIGSNILIKKNFSNPIGRRYLKNIVFGRSLKIWKWFYNNSKPVSKLSNPTYGNQVGAHISGSFVEAGSFFNEVNGSILCNLIKDLEHPVVADLGAGYGKMAYFILRDLNKFTFIDFDLPETLCLAAYYLMKTWPSKKVLLYGEEEYSYNVHKKYDLIFMPSYEIEKVGQDSIDLFVNKNSLGEMSKDAVHNYVTHITNSTRYFFHMNHDVYANVYSDGERGLLGREYPIPMDKFKLIFRYPDIGHMLPYGSIDFDMDIFMYLYERKP